MKFFLSFVTFILISANIALAQTTNPRLLGNDCTPTPPANISEYEEIKITYAGRDDLVYSKARPQKISMLVFHDPGSNSCDILSMVKYGMTIDYSRKECKGGRCGYTFYVGTDGAIVQAAPLTVRTNHFAGHNSYSLGMTLMCAGGKSRLPDAQVKSSINLANALKSGYGFNNTRPHNKGPREGVLIDGISKGNTTSDRKYIINYTLSTGQLYCKVEGMIPPCTNNCDNSNISGKDLGDVRVPSHNFSSPYVNEKGDYVGDSAEWGYPVRDLSRPIESDIQPGQQYPFVDEDKLDKQDQLPSFDIHDQEKSTEDKNKKTDNFLSSLLDSLFGKENNEEDDEENTDNLNTDESEKELNQDFVEEKDESYISKNDILLETEDTIIEQNEKPKSISVSKVEFTYDGFFNNKIINNILRNIGFGK